jgi:hypothetical protein
MSTAASIFPAASAPPPSSAIQAPLAAGSDATKVIETVGVEVLVEVLDDCPRSASNELKAPANGNGPIPFASTLRRVG